MSLAQANVETMAELAALEPFGPGNERPLFVARNLRVIESKANGKDGNTLCLTVAPADSAGGPGVRAVGFGLGAEWAPKLADKPRIDLMFQLELDEWQGQQRVQLRIKGLRLSKNS